jgi:hypothetical protein
LLFGHENYTAPAFTNLLQQLVPADAASGLFYGRHGFAIGRRHPGGGLAQKVTSIIECPQQLFDPSAQFFVSAASDGQIISAL